MELLILSNSFVAGVIVCILIIITTTTVLIIITIFGRSPNGLIKALNGSEKDCETTMTTAFR